MTSAVGPPRVPIHFPEDDLGEKGCTKPGFFSGATRAAFKRQPVPHLQKAWNWVLLQVKRVARGRSQVRLYSFASDAAQLMESTRQAEPIGRPQNLNMRCIPGDGYHKRTFQRR